MRTASLFCLFAWTGALAAQVKIPVLDAIGSFRAVGGNFEQVAFGIDGKTLCTAGERGDLAVWDVKQRRITLSRPAVGARPLSLALSPRGTYVILSCGQPVEGTWAIDIRTGVVLRLDVTGAFRAVFSPDGALCAWVVRGPHGPRLSLIEMNALGGFMVPSPRYVELPFAADNCMFSPDGARIVVSKGRRTSTHPFHLSYRVGDLSASPMRGFGRAVAFADDGRVITQDMSYRLTVGEECLPPRGYWAVSDHGGQIASIRDRFEGTIERHSAPQGSFELRTRLAGIAISPDGTIAAWDLRGRLHVIEAGEVTVLTGHEEAGISELTFSADGKFVAAVGPGSVTMADEKGSTKRTLFGRYCISPGQMGPEFFFASPDGIHRFHAAAGVEVGESWSWPPAVKVFDHDDFGTPDEDRQRLRTLIPIGTRAKFLVRIGDRPRISLFDPDAKALTPVRDNDFPLRQGRTVQMVWSELYEMAYLLETETTYSSGGVRNQRARKRIGGRHQLRAVNLRGEVVANEPVSVEPCWLSLSPDGEQLLLYGVEKSLTLIHADDFKTIRLRTFDMQFNWGEFLSEKHILVHDGKTFYLLDAWTLKVLGGVEIPGQGEITVAAVGPRRKRVAIVRDGMVEIFAVR